VAKLFPTGRLLARMEMELIIRMKLIVLIGNGPK